MATVSCIANDIQPGLNGRMDGNSTGRQGRASLPAVDRLLKSPVLAAAIGTFGRAPVVDAVRAVLDSARDAIAANQNPDVSEAALALRAAAVIERAMTPTLRPVFNLTGTVLHTNLGRAPLPEEALEAIAAVSRGASNLEFDRSLSGVC